MINNRKARPTNGPGSNNLRGGQRVYSGKTAVAGWIENSGGPSGFKRGFTTEEFMTETQHQQSLQKKLEYYGAGLPSALSRMGNTGQLVFKPLNGPQSKDWCSTTQSMHQELLNPKKEYKPTEPENLEEYRKNWTLDTEEGRTIRFNTESRRSTNSAVGQNFQVSSVRILPGTPMGFEKLLRRFISLYGIFALAAIRKEIPTEISTSDFWELLKQFDVLLTKTEFSQMIASITKSTMIDRTRLLQVLTRKLDRTYIDQLEDKYLDMFTSFREVKLHEVYDQLSSSLHQDLYEGVMLFLPLYAEERENEMILTRSGFISFHVELFSSCELLSYYQQVVKALWK